MNRDHLVVKQSSVTNVWQSDAASWQFPQSHTPVARLSMVLAGLHPRRATGRRGVGRKATTFFSLAAGVGALLVFAIVLLGTIYLSGVLLERIQSLQHYNQPQVQYSDVWKWQGHR